MFLCMIIKNKNKNKKPFFGGGGGGGGQISYISYEWALANAICKVEFNQPFC